MKKITLTLIIIISALFVNAQDYSNAVGLRGGLGYGLTFKHFLNETSAVDGILNSSWGFFGVTGLYEIHKPAFDVANLNWFYGGGAHVWFGSSMYLGVDGVLGLDYKFADFPINLSLDWKPAFNIIGSGFYGTDGALSIRYTF